MYTDTWYEVSRILYHRVIFFSLCEKGLRIPTHPCTNTPQDFSNPPIRNGNQFLCILYACYTIYFMYNILYTIYLYVYICFICIYFYFKGVSLFFQSPFFPALSQHTILVNITHIMWCVCFISIVYLCHYFSLWQSVLMFIRVVTLYPLALLAHLCYIARSPLLYQLALLSFIILISFLYIVLLVPSYQYHLLNT